MFKNIQQLHGTFVFFNNFLFYKNKKCVFVWFLYGVLKIIIETVLKINTWFFYIFLKIIVLKLSRNMAAQW